MKTSKERTSMFVMVLLVLLLSACSGQAIEDEITTDPTIEQNPEATLEPTSTPEPISTPVIEPVIIDLGYDAQLLLRGLSEDISVDAVIDLELKGNLPPSNKKYDYVKSEIAVINITQNGSPIGLEKGVAEICFTVDYSGSGEPPAPFYWDTSLDPMVGSTLPKTRGTKEPSPKYMVCTAVKKSGAYAVIMH